MVSPSQKMAQGISNKQQQQLFAHGLSRCFIGVTVAVTCCYTIDVAVVVAVGYSAITDSDQ
jgi:hypothetical protein